MLRTPRDDFHHITDSHHYPITKFLVSQRLTSLIDGTISPLASTQWLQPRSFVQYGIILTVVILISYFWIRKPSYPLNAPIAVDECFPLLGATRFFTHRWDFFRDNSKRSKSGHFSYSLGRYRMVGLSGEDARHLIFFSPNLNMEEGINLLFGGTSRYTSKGESFNAFFLRRIARALKGDRLLKSLPALISDTRSWLEGMAPSGTSSAVTDPFETIYGLVMQLTTRMVICEELANDKVAQKSLLRWNEMIENNTTAATIIFPSFPSPALLRRLYAGARIYMTFDKIMKRRRKSGQRHDDALQIYLNSDDALADINLLLMASLFSGVINSGISGCWLLMYLARDARWSATVEEEIRTVAAKHSRSDDPTRKSLVEQLMEIPLEAWEHEFPMMDLCFRETLRLQTVGTIIRKNSSGHDIPIGNEIIPNGSYATYHICDAHLNPDIYADPEKWDPSRYLPERAEDKKVPDAFLSLGLGRHACAGVRFAKLQANIVTAFWIAMFKWEIVGDALPTTDLNASASSRPKTPVRLRYWRRQE